MYLFKFFKWYWMEYLDDNPTRFIIAFLTWVGIALPMMVTSIVIGMPHLFTTFLMCSAMLAFFTVVGIGIRFMYARYIEWQSQVFDKLKGDK